MSASRPRTWTASTSPWVSWNTWYSFSSSTCSSLICAELHCFGTNSEKWGPSSIFISTYTFVDPCGIHLYLILTPMTIYINLSLRILSWMVYFYISYHVSDCSLILFWGKCTQPFHSCILPMWVYNPYIRKILKLNYSLIY